MEILGAHNVSSYHQRYTNAKFCQGSCVETARRHGDEQASGPLPVRLTTGVGHPWWVLSVAHNMQRTTMCSVDKPMHDTSKQYHRVKVVLLVVNQPYMV
jgi:hypothetical protein